MFSKIIDLNNKLISVKSNSQDLFENLVKDLSPYFFSFINSKQTSKISKIYTLIYNKNNEYEIYENQNLDYVANDYWDLLANFEWYLIKDIVHLESAYAKIHAAVFAKGEKAIVISANKFSGKSLISIKMAELGYKYLSDEIALINVKTNEVLPLPRLVVSSYKGYEVIKKNIKNYKKLEVAPYIFKLSQRNQKEKTYLKKVVFFKRARVKACEFAKISHEAGNRLIRKNSMLPYCKVSLMESIDFYKFRCDDFKKIIKTLEAAINER
ncbi:MAG: hypothetical protein ABIA04_12265 [Pseudomonadota bacterium]